MTPLLLSYRDNVIYRLEDELKAFMISLLPSEKVEVYTNLILRIAFRFLYVVRLLMKKEGQKWCKCLITVLKMEQE